MAYLDTDCPMLERAMKIETLNDNIIYAKGCWTRAEIAGDQMAMDLFERQQIVARDRLETCLEAFKDVFGKNYRLKNPSL